MSFSEPVLDQGGQPVAGDVETPWRLAETIDPQIARALLVTARCGCFMQAARSLNITSSALRRQLSLLEDHVKFPLLRYQDNVLVLSRQGQQLNAHLLALSEERKHPASEQPLVRLAVAESILHDILQRDLIALLRRNACVRLEIISLNSALAVQSVAADVVLWLSESDSEAVLPGPCFATNAPVCLARLQYLPHIAKRYSRVAARPQSLDDLIDYMLAHRPQDGESPGLRPWHRFVEQRSSGVVRVYDYRLMLEMIRCSASIGLFPGYMTRFDRGLVALPGLFGETMNQQVWMAVNAESSNDASVQLIIDLIMNAFRDRGDWFL
ncbi:LysR family transcriptional regulator [Pseudomonas syringae]|nr:LysR family transcriptional regulator [Pseudomonas syringae]MCQ3001063.1 LysR family transcriptional regulator [Pseudomonas syringae]MCQ3031125.1 LysR family transcriptional regulator [Pseudomonas syringae]MDG6398584.1 LysR family transcriptional regulator [Pseudomonas quasicaspiana]